MLNNVTSSSAASHLISLKMKGWDSWWKQLKSSVCVPRILLGSNPRLSALIWLPAGGTAGSEEPPKFLNSEERNICSLEGGDRNLLVIRDRSLIWCGERGRKRERASLIVRKSYRVTFPLRLFHFSLISVSCIIFLPVLSLSDMDRDGFGFWVTMFLSFEHLVKTGLWRFSVIQVTLSSEVVKVYVGNWTCFWGINRHFYR